MTTLTFANLTEWHEKRNSQSNIETLGLPFLFSPPWDEGMRPWYAEYDRLEQQRRASGLLRLSWQDEFESDRFQDRDDIFSPMTERMWVMCPLWVQVLRYKKTANIDKIAIEARRRGWAYLLTMWEEAIRLLREDPGFVASLSPTQARSLALLQSWWSASYCDPVLLIVTKQLFQRQKPNDTWNDPAHFRTYTKVAEIVQGNTSLYHAHLCRLFLLEFQPRTWEPYIAPISLHILQTSRYDSACTAAIQKLAHAVLNPIKTHTIEDDKYPGVLQNDSSHHTLTPEQAATKPTYLWDVQAQWTVEVKTLTKCPEYLCISHTWGRWKKSTSVAMPNVPWRVPENHMYDVKTLPEQLKHLGFQYVWLDLFCIPQDEEDTDRKRTEVAKQASIFKGSARCIAWLHDVESWQGVLAALDWIALKSLSITSTRDEAAIQAALTDATFAARVAPEIIRWVEVEGSNPAQHLPEPSSWFSSLWTLQECVLCPDIQLYSWAWERLEDRRGTPLSLQPLMAILRDTQAFCWLEGRIATPFNVPTQYHKAINTHPSRARLRDNVANWNYPTGPKDLYLFCSMTRLDNVLTSGSPGTVLMNSDLRQCSVRRPADRASAIMSAVGVTDWYSELTQEDASELVLDRYPLAFFREAARKFGAIFYYSEGMGNNMSRVNNPYQKRGTMLPVSTWRGWHGAVTGDYEVVYIDRLDHETVSGWVTQGTDGNIAILSAGVTMTSTDPEGKPIQGTLSCATAEDDQMGRPKMRTGAVSNMLATLKELQFGRRRMLAIALFHDNRALYGVLLEELGVSRGRVDMAKIGTFMMPNVSLPPSTGVNWNIL
ncbi:hypothetical protein F5X68DRAFT_135678 [Plectosphaerella plurivora]|uniref:Heterokaryon incompatibility domain-containing protein n=1 Tax=Plectosphaerella plurivora TaxID=936078 RepID=A0A9P8VBB9_9PEZI|nr:hypothetical protein F5X68DRAFT_135678 [Plectosphaerella plurivora]